MFKFMKKAVLRKGTIKLVGGNWSKGQCPTSEQVGAALKRMK